MDNWENKMKLSGGNDYVFHYIIVISIPAVDEGNNALQRGYVLKSQVTLDAALGSEVTSSETEIEVKAANLRRSYPTCACVRASLRKKVKQSDEKPQNGEKPQHERNVSALNLPTASLVISFLSKKIWIAVP